MGAFKWNMMCKVANLRWRCEAHGLSTVGSGHRGAALKHELARRLAWFERGRYYIHIRPEFPVFANPKEDEQLHCFFIRFAKRCRCHWCKAENAKLPRSVAGSASLPKAKRGLKQVATTMKVNQAMKATKPMKAIKVMKAMKAKK